MAKQGNLRHPTPRPAERDEFYKDIDKDAFIDNLRVGLQLQERIKAILPKWLVRKLKELIG